ncbi:hypothetical protein Q4508_07530 [Amphritea sp. 2_MG-2023]|uniref:hypothetical protein n=1 Tax=Amphritea atlantica TaxID=355243 RepID=UPI0020902B46|nr:MULTISPECIES: hypothetical protein [Amphritea]MDO6418406.1 hypothetical protein [Amphritea sp. 2_MG-2023]MDX2422982.1 hypothetical protein [Amphritea sp.]
MEPLILFLITGFVSMSAALSAGQLNKLPEAEKSAFLQSRNGAVMVVMAGNVAALTLIGSLAYGFRLLEWWIPLSSIFISFPAISVGITQRLFGDKLNLSIMLPLTLVSAGLLYYFW